VARGWAAKLKFLRSSDDAATHKKFKRFTLAAAGGGGGGGGDGGAAVAAPSLAFFSQYKLSPPSLRLSIDYRAFAAHPDTAQPRRPSRRCLRLATFTPRN